VNKVFDPCRGVSSSESILYTDLSMMFIVLAVGTVMLPDKPIYLTSVHNRTKRITSYSA
jgi:hypothetical protein